MRSFILVPRPRGRLCPQRSLPIRSGHCPLLISNALRRGAGVYLPAHARAAYTSRPPRTLTPIFPPLLSPPFFSFPPLSLLPPLSSIRSCGVPELTWRRKPATQGVPMEPQPRRAALGGVYTHTPPRRTTPDGETTSPRGGGRRSEGEGKGNDSGSTVIPRCSTLHDRALLLHISSQFVCFACECECE